METQFRHVRDFLDIRGGANSLRLEYSTNNWVENPDPQTPSIYQQGISVTYVEDTGDVYARNADGRITLLGTVNIARPETVTPRHTRQRFTEFLSNGAGVPHHSRPLSQYSHAIDDFNKENFQHRNIEISHPVTHVAREVLNDLLNEHRRQLQDGDQPRTG